MNKSIHARIVENTPDLIALAKSDVSSIEVAQAKLLIIHFIQRQLRRIQLRLYVAPSRIILSMALKNSASKSIKDLSDLQERLNKDLDRLKKREHVVLEKKKNLELKLQEQSGEKNSWVNFFLHCLELKTSEFHTALNQANERGNRIAMSMKVRAEIQFHEEALRSFTSKSKLYS